MRKLDEINKDILNKIDRLDEDINIKNFLKDALSEEISNRDENYAINNKRNVKYEQLINKYYEAGK